MPCTNDYSRPMYDRVHVMLMIDEQRPALSNDDLLYDPEMDDEDQRWVDRQRQRYQAAATHGGAPKRLPNSDAVLNCPACMSLLCLDCQRLLTADTRAQLL